MKGNIYTSEKTKQNKTKQNKTKQNKTKQNKTKQNFLLDRDDKREILFILPMAIGDFCYTRMVLKVMQEQYPDCTFDVMFDEFFHIEYIHRGKGQLVNLAVCDWAEEGGLFRDVYRDLYMGDGTLALKRAKERQYPIIISLAGRGARRVAEAMRELSADGIVVSWEIPSKWWMFGIDRMHNHRFLDFEVSESICTGEHMVERYANFFRAFCEIPSTDWVAQAHMEVPNLYQRVAREKLQDMGIPTGHSSIFINPFAKNRKRTWSLNKTAQCIRLLQKNPLFANVHFLINGLPSDQTAILNTIGEHDLERCHPFTAEGNFFELPAILQEARLVVTVETAVMHLASLLRVPQVVMMRLKTPWWRPLQREKCLIIENEKRSQHIEDIRLEDVVQAVETMWRTHT